jgi:hypothetical protein
MSAELHEMHALLQQLRELNEAHDLDHCETWLGDMASAAGRKVAAASNAVVAGGKAVIATGKGAIKAHQDHAETVATQKARDATVLAKWGTITDPVQQRTVLKSAIDLADPIVVGPLFLANPATKDHFQTSVENYSAPVAA